MNKDTKFVWDWEFFIKNRLTTTDKSMKVSRIVRVEVKPTPDRWQIWGIYPHSNDDQLWGSLESYGLSAKEGQDE